MNIQGLKLIVNSVTLGMTLTLELLPPNGGLGEPHQIATIMHQSMPYPD